MQLCDSHCHLDFSEFDNDRDEIVASCRVQGVTRMIIPGVTRDTWDRLLECCKRYEGLYPALGLHPYFLREHKDSDLIELAGYVRRFSPVAIGEIGLDYAIKDLDRQMQIKYFSQQLKLAGELSLPVIIHARKAHDDVLSLLRQYRINRGIIHAYSGSEDQAMRYIELGFMLGFGGAMTWNRSTRLQSLAANLPLESIVLETDAPDMPPEGHQGKRNSPQYLPGIMARFCQLRYESCEKIAMQLTQNVNKTFGLPI